MDHINEKTKLMICSVGGAPQPIVYSLKTIKPKYVIFYCSTSTVDNVNTFIRECDFIEKHSVIETDNWEDIDYNLQFLYEKLPEHLSRRNVTWEEVLVDYTGGTKTMGAALVLATVDKGVNYAYVSGNERSKEGTGIVIDGSEKILLKSNPWNTIAYEQRKLISNAFNYGRYDEAINLATNLKNNLNDSNHWKFIAEGLIDLFTGYKEWDKFRHKIAKDALYKGLNNLKPYRFLEESINLLLTEVEENIKILNNFNSKDQRIKQTFILEDLIANAIRRGDREQKYDDGVARLYRAVELFAQVELSLEYNINTSKCKLEQIPETIREEFEKKYWSPDDNCLKFGLQASYQLLHELNNEIGNRFYNNKIKISNLLTIRNQSILAHGLTPVSKKGYEDMLQTVLELTSIEKEVLISFPRLDL